jgi:hypothetical protein
MNADQVEQMVQSAEHAIVALRNAQKAAQISCTHTRRDGSLAITSRFPQTSLECVPYCSCCNLDGHEHPERFEGIKYQPSEQRQSDPGRMYADPGFFVKETT